MTDVEKPMNMSDSYEVTRLHNVMYETEALVDDSIDALIDILDSIADTYDESSIIYRELSMIEDRLKKAGKLLDEELD